MNFPKKKSYELSIMSIMNKNKLFFKIKVF